MTLVTGLGTSLVVTTLGVAFGPPVLSFGVAAAAAACWCAWLDRHPDA
jgi:hypothetical protein